MQLQRLFSRIPPTRVHKVSGSTEVVIRALAYDSRRVQKDSLFFAVEGAVTDGNRFADEAIRQGAVAIVSEREPLVEGPVTWIRVRGIRRVMAQIASEFYGNPSHQLELVGVTGTNGKTTTASLIHSVLSQDQPSLLMGTVQTVISGETIESRLTTPEAIDIQENLRRALEAGCRRGVVEVSSHSLFFDRVYACRFPVAVFTNLSRDHLDLHGSMQEYLLSKQRLFDPDYNRGLRETLLNQDDPTREQFRPLDGVNQWSYGFSHQADVYPIDYESTIDGTRLNLNFFGGRLALESPLVGSHNLYNLMAAAGACYLSDLPRPEIQQGIANLKRVPGRFEKVEVEAPFSVIVDFAHTPDALLNVLKLSGEVADGRVICVFGCGGDRDPGKRPKMGSLAVQEADYVIVTSDNPRSEDPSAIVDDILAGIPPECTNYEVVVQRVSAIQRALELASPGDLVLLAGKGHETYQEIHGKKIDLDERVVVKEALCSS